MFKSVSCIEIIFSLILLFFISHPANAAVYTYDALNRLTSVTYQNGQKIVYTYDPGGNMLNVSHHSSPDIIPLTIISTNPVDGASDVSVCTSVYVAFSETVIEDVYFKDINIRNTNDNSVVNYIYSINGDTLTLDPVNDLSSSVSYAVYVPAGAVKDGAGNSLENDYVFSFTTGELTSGFTVTIPNGGENWTAGATKEITWSYAGSGCPADVRISLYKSGIYQYIITNSVLPESGSYSWTLPASQAAGDDYQIRITSNADINVYDYSDARFTINTFQ